MYQTVSSLVLWKFPAAGGWLWGREWLMQNVPSPQEIFLPHTHNPATSYLYNVVISYSTYATDLSPGRSWAWSWSKGQRFVGSWLLSLACRGLLASVILFAKEILLIFALLSWCEMKYVLTEMFWDPLMECANLLMESSLIITFLSINQQKSFVRV